MIEAKALTKHYGPLIAVDDISFTVRPGEVLGFLGPNGAGKTTTMRMIAGFVTPTSGQASVCGHSIEDDATAAKRSIGYLPEGAPVYGEMRPLEYLGFVAEIRGLRGTELSARLADVVERLHLETVVNQRIETLSKGYKRRVGLAQAIIHDPPVLILDEPTDGLDPNQKHEVRQLIGDMAADKIIVISTHILEEVDAVCSRAVIINHGKIVADETPDSLVRKSRYHNAVTIRLERADGMTLAEESLAGLDAVESVERDPENSVLTAFPRGEKKILTSISELAATENWPLEELHLESGRLDEVFRSITREGAS